MINQPRKIFLKRLRLNAYITLLSATRCQLYVPGFLDTVMFRAPGGEWLLDADVFRASRMWKDAGQSMKVVYEDADLEASINEELAALICETILDDS